MTARLRGDAAHDGRPVQRGRRVCLLPSRDAGPEDSRRFEIRRLSDSAVVGSLEISRIARGNFQSAYLGYRIDASLQGRGFMTEALQLALRHAFRNLKLHRVEANIEPGNEASIALVRRAGFSREGFSRRYLKLGGRWRDHERWALLREDWQPLRGDSRTGRAGRASGGG